MKGLEEAAKIPGVADIQTYRKIGDCVSIENDFRDRIGHVISCAGTGLDASRSSEMARSKIEIQIEPR
jgi:biotin carboxylase